LTSLVRGFVQTARDFSATDPEIFSRIQIIESGVDEQLYEARRDHADRVERIEASLSKNKLEQIAVERRQAELSIAQAERGLAILELRAPEDGVIMFERDWQGNVIKVGDTVWGGATIARLPVLDRMQAEVFVLEADAGGLAAGKPAEVVLEAHPERTYAGRIARVDTMAKRPATGSPTQYFAVVIALEKNDPARMKTGGRVRATLVLDRREALSVPRHAIFEREERPVALRLEAGRFEPVPVKLGATTPGRVVVEEGLAAGDVIALVDPSATAAPGGVFASPLASPTDSP
jgi:RND family efflux transporter MFP subunit